jgi:NADP-dependent 3-hydroxy acid dehydrogenase YdfG
MESELTGTAALVTGASSGIGAATARRLAAHGAAVALVARRRDRLEALAAEISEAGGTALAVEADITYRAQAEATVQQAAGRFGRLDTLVNNAGLMLLGPVADADPEEWDRMIAINVKACSVVDGPRAAGGFHCVRSSDDFCVQDMGVPPHAR